MKSNEKRQIYSQQNVCLEIATCRVSLCIESSMVERQLRLAYTCTLHYGALVTQQQQQLGETSAQSAAYCSGRST